MIEDRLSKSERNPVTHRIHQREVFWQITIPLILGALIVLGFAAAVSIGSTQEVSRWSEISLIWLIIPVLFVSLLFLVILAGLVYAATWILRNLPPYTRLAQDAVARIGEVVRKGADKTVEPVLRIHMFFAAWRALRRR
jgi:amino acid transporter